MFAIFIAAGWPIWFLLLTSIVTVALIIERFIALKQNKIIPPGLLMDVLNLHQNQQVTPEVLAKLKTNSPFGQILAVGLQNAGASRDVLKTAVEEVGRHVTHRLSRFLNTLGTIASAAPLMGLFGTVVGMIEIFGATGGATGSTNVAQLGHGISVALYNTGFAILIAIPALIAYRYFRGKVDDLVIEMEQQAIRLIDVVQGSRK